MRQQIKTQRSRANTGSGWFGVGLLSATALAPLIARWNALRTSNRTQTLRELAAARLSEARGARDQAMHRLAPVRAAANARLDEALALANTRLEDARELASARLEDARELAGEKLDDALVRLAQVNTPEVLQNIPPFSFAKKRAEQLARQRRRRTTILWLAGVGIGLAAAGGAAYVIARRRMVTTLEEEGPMVELPPEKNLAGAATGKAQTMRNSYASSAERAEISVPIQSFAAAGTSGQARYIGNIHTMIFHDADDVSHLPSEENRIYFSSEAEARQAGYRHAREPEAPSETENQ